MKTKIKSLIEAKEILKKEKVLLLKKYGISDVGIFGSFAFGDFNQKSDIDILINFNKRNKISLLDLVGIENDLSSKLGRKVDLVTAKGLNPYIKDNVLKSTVYV
jgi:predicted nucleotidyltransferase